MSTNITFILMYHRHKILDIIYKEGGYEIGGGDKGNDGLFAYPFFSISSD
jgi:hypothetical protein